MINEVKRQRKARRERQEESNQTDIKFINPVVPDETPDEEKNETE